MIRQFDVYFSGETLDGQDPEAIKLAVGDLFGISGAKLDALFSGTPIRIKKNLNADKAGRFREVFRNAGAVVQIVPAGKPPGENPSQQTTATSGGLNLAPAGSRLSTEPAVAQPPPGANIPPTDHLKIAPQNPFSDPPPSAGNDAHMTVEIATSHLEAAPPRSGSLETFTQQRAPVPLPDISSLSLAPLEEETKDEEEAESPEMLPDTSHLQASPPNSGSLEDCTEEKPPVPIPDISGLSLDD